MPFLSVVVPAYNVQAYLREAITSVLDQDFTDVEVVAVDDRSPDNSGAIIDELAARDPRVRPIHLAENVGLGGARNAGMAAATGDYLMFLDGDDTLTPGSLSAIARRLRNNDLPELLIYNYARVWWDGRRAVSWGDEILAALSPHPFAPRHHRRLFNLLPIACNKVYRRDLLERLGASFPPGFYEDIAFTYSVLLNTETAVTLNRVVLAYRQRRGGGSILASTSPRHFDVFAQYDRVFAEADRLDLTPGMRKHLYDIMVNHFVTILRHEGRLAASEKPAFYATAGEYARRYLPARSEDTVDNKASNLRGALLRDHSYRRFRMYAWLDERRRPARRMVGRVYWPVRRALRRLRAVTRLYYPIARLMPLDPKLVVFSEYWGTGYGCNPRALFERLREIAPDYRAVWVIEPDKGRNLPAGVVQVSPDSPRRWRYFARATYFVNNVNFPGVYVKRPGQVHIQTMHGTPLKYCGLDVMRSAVASSAVAPMRTLPKQDGQVVATDDARNRQEFADLLRRSDRWDYALSSNPYSTEMWSHAYPCSYEWLEYGYPRNDALVRATADDVARARAGLGLQPHQTVVLYAPTFREAIGDTSLRIDFADLVERVPDDYVFLVRAHHTTTLGPKVKALAASGRIIEGSSLPAILECYLAADLLITDYSSVMFDYALLDRPIVIYADDWDQYREARGTYFDLLAEPPGPVAMNQRELATILGERRYRDGESEERRAAFRARFCAFDDGDAAERVIRRVMLPS